MHDPNISLHERILSPELTKFLPGRNIEFPTINFCILSLSTSDSKKFTKAGAEKFCVLTQLITSVFIFILLSKKSQYLYKASAYFLHFTARYSHWFEKKT